MYEPNLDRVAERIIGDSLRVQPGDNVLIEVRSDIVPFAERVAQEVFKAGGICTVLLNSDELRYVELTELQAGHDALLAPAYQAAIEGSQHVIRIGLEPAEPMRFIEVAAHQKAERLRRQAAADAILFQPGRKVMEMEFPTRYMAESMRMPWNRLHEFFWRATDVDYRMLARRVAAAADLLERARDIRLTTPRGTDLRLQRGQGAIHRDDGYVRAYGSVPAGEVSFAPRADRVTGRVVVDYAFVEGTRISDIEILFENGIGVPQGAPAAFDLFLSEWERAPGGKNRLGRVGIGLNDEVRSPVGFPLLDKKAFGMVHLGLCDSRMLIADSPGFHLWKMHLARPTLLADDHVLLQNGALADL